MMIVRFTVCVLVLFIALFDVLPLWTHEGHIHVVTGTVTAMSDSHLIANNIDGQTGTIQLATAPDIAPPARQPAAQWSKSVITWWWT